MWGIVLWMGIVAAPDPIRLGIAILLISRPRPLLNLFAFWLGGMATGLVSGLVALLLLRDSLPGLVHRFTSTFASFTGGHTQVVIGVLFLTIATVSAVRFARQQVLVSDGGPPARVPQSGPPSAFSQLWTRARDTLENGNPWVAFVVGLSQATPAVQYLPAITAILASGAAISTQLSAVVAFTIATFVLVEIPLVSYLVAPAKTEAVTLQVHDWMRTHRRRIFVVSAGVSGVVLLARGMGFV